MFHSPPAVEHSDAYGRRHGVPDPGRATPVARTPDGPPGGLPGPFRALLAFPGSGSWWCSWSRGWTPSAGASRGGSLVYLRPSSWSILELASTGMPDRWSRPFPATPLLHPSVGLTPGTPWAAPWRLPPCERGILPRGLPSIRPGSSWDVLGGRAPICPTEMFARSEIPAFVNVIHE